jgi:hypothetical protein
MVRAYVVALAAACLAAPAVAQQPITDTETIARCLCLGQELSARSNGIAMGRQALDQAQADAARLNQEVQQRRPLVQVDKPGDVVGFTGLLYQSERAERRVTLELAPAYNGAVGVYNQRIETYSKQCAGKFFDTAATEQTKSKLVCPKP